MDAVNVACHGPDASSTVRVWPPTAAAAPLSDTGLHLPGGFGHAGRTRSAAIVCIFRVAEEGSAPLEGLGRLPQITQVDAQRLLRPVVELCRARGTTCACAA